MFAAHQGKARKVTDIVSTMAALLAGIALYCVILGALVGGFFATNPARQAGLSPRDSKGPIDRILSQSGEPVD